ncbi:MAG: hypothetical protein JNM63_05505 [Spirochaetia bacterium]|nr:hypothetical protein [Spirochaetia bacterium]
MGIKTFFWKFGRTGTALVLSLASFAWTQEAVKTEKDLKNTGLVSEDVEKQTTKNISKKKALLVLPARAGSAVPDTVLEKTSEILGGVLIDLGRFRVVDRKALKKAMEQMAISATGLIPEGKQTEMGKIVGATEIIIPEVVSYSVTLQERISAGNVIENLIGMATGSGGGKKLTEQQWVAAAEVRVVHKDLATGLKVNDQSFRAESVSKSKSIAENNLDNQLEAHTRKTIRDMFPIVSFVTKQEDRNTYFRLGQDMGVKKDMKFFVYEKWEKDKKNTPVGEVIVREVFPTLSMGELRIRQKPIKENMTVKERNLDDLQLGFWVGIAPMKFSSGTLRKFNDYVSWPTSSVFSGFGLSDWVNVFSTKDVAYTYVPQLAIDFYKLIGQSALGFRIAGLLAGPVDAVGFKLLAGYKNNLIDRDFFSAGFSVHAGAASAYAPIGTIKDGWYIPADSTAGLENPVNFAKTGRTLSLAGFTYGGEVAVQVGFNLGFDARLQAEVGYAYYAPMSRFVMTTLDDKDKPVFLTKYFEASQVGPLDFSGLTFALNLHFMF